MRWLALLVVIFVVLVMAGASASNSLESQQQQSLEDLSVEAENLATSRDSSSQEVHKRSKRTIGHIFDMFRQMMDGLFGGKKGGKGGKGKGKGRGRPRRPQRPGQPPGGYGAPRPQNNNLSGGYAGGQRPRPPPRARPRPQSAPNNYGGPPPQQAPNNYGSPPSQQAPNNYGSPPSQQAPNSYGGPPPQQAPSNNYGSPQTQNNPDSYGAPQADPVGPAQDSYGAPQAPPVGPAQDSYGAPQADPVGPAQDSYGAPQAAPVGPAPDSYGSPQANPVGPSPQAPISNYGRGQSSAPRRPTNSGSFGPGSAIKILPAPNLATEAPAGANFNRQVVSGGGGGGAPDSYGSPLANTISGNSAGAQDSYGSPQGGVISDNSGGRGAGDSYGSPQGGVISAAAPQSGGAPDSYGSPQGGVVSSPGPQFNSNNNNFGSAQVTSQYQVSNDQNSFSQNNPFLIQGGQQATYNAAPLPVTNNSPFNTGPSNSAAAAPQSTYGNSVQSNSNSNNYASPISDIDLPGGSNPIIVEGRNPQTQDVYGSPVAPVGTSAPVPESVISAERQQTSFDTYNDDADNEFGIDSLADPNSISTPEGELASIQDDGEGAASPLFDDLRNVAFTSADDTTEALAPLEVDLSDGVVDLTNGLDTYNNNEVDLTSVDNYEATTVGNVEVTELPEYEDAGYYDDEYEYIGDEDTPPADLEDIVGLRSDEELESEDNNLADAQESYGDAQETYGNSIQDARDEYYYEGDSEYYYEYEDDQAAGSQDTTEAAPGDVAVEDGGNFISVPLMIEEIDNPNNAAPVILAGTAKDNPSTNGGYATSPQPSYEEQQPQYGGRAGRNSSPFKRKAPQQVFQQFSSPEPELPQAKRQADWSQRIETRRRNRVWRQFNLD